MALLHIVLWLIHAVTTALASALVDVFTHLASGLIALTVLILTALGIAGAFGLGGFGLFRRLRRRNG